MLPAQADAGGQGQGFALPDRRLLALGVIAFCGLLGEGAMGDWSAVYLDQSLGADVEVAAMAFAVFSLTMALGRFSGDRVVARLGGGAGGLRRRRARGARAGRHAADRPARGRHRRLRPDRRRPFLHLPGGALGGDAHARHLPPAPRSPASARSAIFGFLIGPPAIGGLAELLGLPAALGAVVLLFVLIAVLGNRAPTGPDGRAFAWPALSGSPP